jgi:hypothetical protein
MNTIEKIRKPSIEDLAHLRIIIENLWFDRSILDLFAFSTT